MNIIYISKVYEDLLILLYYFLLNLLVSNLQRKLHAKLGFLYYLNLFESKIFDHLGRNPHFWFFFFFDYWTTWTLAIFCLVFLLLSLMFNMCYALHYWPLKDGSLACLVEIIFAGKTWWISEIDTSCCISSCKTNYTLIARYVIWKL